MFISTNYQIQSDTYSTAFPTYVLPTNNLASVRISWVFPPATITFSSTCHEFLWLMLNKLEN
jgi:hypothetical protein